VIFEHLYFEDFDEEEQARVEAAWRLQGRSEHRKLPPIDGTQPHAHRIAAG
jgi:hypothetical protein